MYSDSSHLILINRLFYSKVFLIVPFPRDNSIFIWFTGFYSIKTY